MLLTGKILLLLFAANGAPILLLKLLDGRYARALDGGRVWPDGRPWFGPSKTWRGVAGALLAGALAGWGLGLGAGIGLQAGALTMLGDVLSSFLKRRLGVPSSGMALGLDQIPEALLPLLWLQSEWRLSGGEVLGLALAFLVLELGLSRVLYRLHVRREPY